MRLGGAIASRDGKQQDDYGNGRYQNEGNGGQRGIGRQQHVIPHLFGQRRLQAAADEDRDRQLVEGNQEGEQERRDQRGLQQRQHHGRQPLYRRGAQRVRGIHQAPVEILQR